MHEHGKLPPQALDLEEAVLGALMLEKDALTDVIDKLKPENFYKEVHQKIYQAICDLFSKSEPTDYLTVINELKRNGDLEVVGPNCLFVSAWVPSTRSLSCSVVKKFFTMITT